MSDDGKVEVMLIGDDGKGEVMLIGIALVLTLTFCAGHYFGEKDMCKEIKGPRAVVIDGKCEVLQGAR